MRGRMAGLLRLVVHLALLLAISQAVTYHKNRIAENGARFNQRVLIDRRAGVEIFHIPAHNGQLELKELYDFNKGLVLRCQPKKKTCYLSEFDKKNYESPAKLEKNLRAYERHHHSARTEEKRESVRKENLYVVDNSPIEAGKLFTPRMRKFLGNYKLYREAKLPEGAEVIKDDGPPAGEKRDKRGLFSLSVSLRARCQYRARAVIKYVPMPRRGGRSCERVWYCPSRLVYSSCHYRLTVIRSYSRCLCCPEHTRTSQCFRSYWG